MIKNMAIPTIPEIARIAGVSTATVDRVLNRRPGVNPETERKVLEVMAQLGAAPARGRPRRSGNFKFAFVLPAMPPSYFDMVDRLIAQSAGELRHQHITPVTLRLDTRDANAFADELQRLEEYDGIALLAPDLPGVKVAVNALVRNGVHVVSLLSDLSGSMRETLVSGDDRAAGRVAGLLLGRMSRPAEKATLMLVSNATRYSSEIDRRVGFAQIIEERFSWLNVVRITDLPEDEDDAYLAFKQYLGSKVDPEELLGIYNVGSGTFGICQALEDLRIGEKCAVIAHALTDVNRELLMSGKLAYVLNQDIHYCISTSARVLRALCENVRGALSVVPPRVEILTSENLI
jgi:LacI family transcriptional regulator